MTELKANSAWGIHILEIQNKKKKENKIEDTKGIQNTPLD